MQRTLIAALLACVTCVSALASDDRSMVRALSTAPGTLDPLQASLANEFEIILDLYEGLTSYGPKGEIVPGVAREWTTSNDGLTWRFELDADARWSDGTPVTATQFVAAFRRLMSPQEAAPYANLYTVIENGADVLAGTAPPEALGVVARASDRLEINLAAPTVYFDELLALPASMPLRADRDQLEIPVSNGAYQLTQARVNDRYVAVSNPSYRQADTVAIRTLSFQVIEDPNTCVRRFTAGEVHYCDYLPTNLALELREGLGTALRLHPTASVFFYALNTQTPPLDDVRVRRALNLLVDRGVLAADIFGGIMIPTLSLVPPGVRNYLPEPPRADFADQSYFQRLTEARTLLTAAGITPDTPITLTLAHSTIPDEVPLALYIAHTWADLGVNLTFEQRDFAAHYAMLDGVRSYDVVSAGWIADFLDPVSFLDLFVTDGFYNYANATDTTPDTLLDMAALHPDPQARATLLGQAEQHVLDSHAYIPLVNLTLPTLVSNRVEGWIDNETDVNLTRHLRFAD